jgi:hypothetical protein
MLHRLHRYSAVILVLYISGHLLNHGLALQGIAAHIAFMEAYRHLYRAPAVETLLLGCAAFQSISGLYFVYIRRGQRQDFWEKAQAASGLYLAFFLLVHVGAVLYGRLALGLDTNFWYAAAGLNITPLQWFFLPYYFLAVLAIFTHLACALHWLTRAHFNAVLRTRLAGFTLLAGGVLSCVIVATFSGAFYTVDVPAVYRATYGR